MTFFSSISLLAALFFSIVSVLLLFVGPLEEWAAARLTGKVAILSPLSTSTVANFTSGAAGAPSLFFLPILPSLACVSVVPRYAHFQQNCNHWWISSSSSFSSFSHGIHSVFSHNHFCPSYSTIHTPTLITRNSNSCRWWNTQNWV